MFLDMPKGFKYLLKKKKKSILDDQGKSSDRSRVTGNFHSHAGPKSQLAS